MVSLHLYILYYIWLIFEGKCTEIYHTVDGMFFVTFMKYWYC